jgi:hypothetical protein
MMTIFHNNNDLYAKYYSPIFSSWWNYCARQTQSHFQTIDDEET